MVDLDKPDYAKPFLENEEYSPCKSLKVFMPKFDGTEAEEWLYQVRRFFYLQQNPRGSEIVNCLIPCRRHDQKMVCIDGG